VLSALLLGGVRLGAVNGLQLQAAVPRELGSALIALIVLFVSAPELYRWFLGKGSGEIGQRETGVRTTTNEGRNE
jgi:ABC-type uncharacterized transport system permease subunit